MKIFKSAIFKSLILVLAGFFTPHIIQAQTAVPTATPVATPQPTTTTAPANQPAAWKTIKVGKKNSADLLVALKRVFVSDSAKSFITNFAPATTSPEEESVSLALVTATQLGLKGDDITFQQITEAAGKLGLKICPPEVGVYLRYQYIDQPNGERIFIAMNPIEYQGQKRVFTLDQGGNYAWLYTINGFPSLTPTVDAWSPDFKWVFVRSTP